MSVTCVSYQLKQFNRQINSKKKKYNGIHLKIIQKHLKNIYIQLK